MKSFRRKKIIICVISIIICVILNYYLSSLQSCVFNMSVLLVAIAFVLVKTLKVPGMSDVIPVVSVSLYQMIKKVLSQSLAAEAIKNFWETILNYTLLKIGISESYTISEELGISISFLSVFLILLFLCNKDDQTAMKIHTESKPIFVSDDYIKDSDLFCQNLIQRIKRMNYDYGWDDKDFTALDAEVELNINGKRKKKYGDLFKCLKKSKIKDGAYLVLGEPGSGKSVALRKLCSELLGESKTTGKIPVYINLKNWNINWNMDYLPKKSDLNTFIKNELCGDGDEKALKFVDKYFDIIQDDGRWYYVFDSFDELPCLLGDNISNELIERITNLLYDYMTGAGQIGGIIASRLSKCPSSTNGNYIVLKIRAFDNKKIRKALKKYIGSSYRTIIKKIYAEREDLVPLCRNPFYLSLIRHYLNKYNMSLPKNQMELFDSFIVSVLEKHEGKIHIKKTSIEDVQKSAMVLAARMEAEAFGLEYPIKRLLSMDKEYWEKHLSILEYCRLCRIGNHRETVTFVHRRFQEYFLVKHYIKDNVIDEQTIVNTISNSGGKRDALALYCEVADRKLVTIIAEHCFSIIKANIDYSRDIYNSRCLILVNSLYFMREAFKNRKNILNDKIDEFEIMISDLLIPETDFIVQVALANCIVLFDSEKIKNLSIKIIKLNNKWLNDIAIDYCRLIKTVDSEFEIKLTEFLMQLNIETLFRSFSTIQFSLSISNTLFIVRLIHVLLLLLDCIIIAFPMIVSVVISLSIYNPVSGFIEKSLFSKYGIVKVCSLLIVCLLLYVLVVRGLIEIRDEDKITSSSTFLASLMLIVVYNNKDELINNINNSVLGTRLVNYQYFYLSVLHSKWLLLYFGPLIIVVFGIIILYAQMKIRFFIKIFQDGRWSIILKLDFWIKLIKEFWGNFVKSFIRLFQQAFIAIIILTFGLMVLYITVTYLPKYVITTIVAILAIGIMVFLIKDTFQFMYERHTINMISNRKSIDRELLEEEMGKLKHASNKYYLLKQLIKNCVNLTGDWKEHKRPFTDNRKIDFALAKIDSSRLASYYYLF